MYFSTKSFLIVAAIFAVSSSVQVQAAPADEEEAGLVQADAEVVYDPDAPSEPPTDLAVEEATEAPTAAPITPSYQYDLIRNALPTCFDYRSVFSFTQAQCTNHYLFNLIREEYEIQSKSDWAKKWSCQGGITKEVMSLTGVESKDIWTALTKLCTAAQASEFLEQAVEYEGEWNGIEDSGINLEDFFQGGTVLNNEIGNLQQSVEEFIRRGGADRYAYMGTDPRLNDYFPTTEESYQGGQAIYKFYEEELSKKFLKSPTEGMKGNEDGTGMCTKTNAAMCCWSKDRQYNDNNGSCSLGNCAFEDPGDNTDLCWIEGKNPYTQANEVFPYPNNDGSSGTERPLHCHGVAWSNLEQEFGDVNNDAKFNNLFYVSMYDHLYKRGYAQSVTDAPNFNTGEQAMCGCVEDMAVVARADCTEARGSANYTATQDPTTGLLQVALQPDSFRIEFKACEGFKYKNDPIFTPEYYQEQRKTKSASSLGLASANNDLSSFVFKQHLEGKISKDLTENYSDTVIGYKTFDRVNGGNADEKRNALCEEKFQEKFGAEAKFEKNIVGDPQNDNFVQYGCTKFNGNSRHAYKYDTTKIYNTFTASTCNEACVERGYEYFGYECPRNSPESWVDCVCYSESNVVDSNNFEPKEEDCNAIPKAQNNVGQCDGPGSIAGFSLGGHVTGSIYKTIVYDADGNPIVDEVEETTITCSDPTTWTGYSKQCGKCAALVKTDKNSCAVFCANQNLECVDGWDDTNNNNCSLNAPKKGCDFKFASTSDAICVCQTPL